MRIGLLKENSRNEQRVALVPEEIKHLSSLGHKLYIEKGAGNLALFSDEDYKKCGADIVERQKIISFSDILISIYPPSAKELRNITKPLILIVAFFYGNEKYEVVPKKSDITIFALNRLSRLSNLQNMDVLSSQDALGGSNIIYNVASKLKKNIPLMTTASKTLLPATFLVIGIGVLGLSALATAKRLGAITYAYDINPQTSILAKSVGAKFVILDNKTKLKSFLKRTDVLICSAFNHNKPAVSIIDESDLKVMKPGSIVVDAGARYGGNVAISDRKQITYWHDLLIYSIDDWANFSSNSASVLLSKNIANFFSHYFKDGKFDFSEPTIKQLIV